ncbi:hypothetical protein [Streptomyces poriticola]|uniref:hypothetical protein n=1 Tax=Streptomyces poriticola TaxID=3120506 RepID=UPI002FCDFEA9
MRERPEVGGDGGDSDIREEGEGRTRRIDLSVPQVAGGALAAVIAAKLASSFGVYGTILGAGLISVVATCGGTVFQHLFQRTGEQFRGRRAPDPGGAVAATPVVAGPAGQSRGQAPPQSGEFTEGTVYRARARGWKRPLVAAALVFGVTMTGVTAYELASGESLSGGGSATTVGAALTGRTDPAPDSGSSQDLDGSDGSDDSGGQGDPGGSADSADSDRPADSDGSGSGSGRDTPSDGDLPSGTPSGSGGDAESGSETAPGAGGDQSSGGSTAPDPDPAATPPAPSADSRSGTGAPGRDGPATP